MVLHRCSLSASRLQRTSVSEEGCHILSELVVLLLDIRLLRSILVQASSWLMMRHNLRPGNKSVQVFNTFAPGIKACMHAG